MTNNLRQDLSKGNYRAVIPVAVDGMAQVERPNAATGNGGTAFVDTVTLVDQTGNILGTSGNPVYVSGGTGPGGTSSANAIANASTQSFASGSSNFLQADLTGALKVNVVAGGGSSSSAAVANSATQSFANGTSNPLQADLTGALKVNVIAGGSSGANIGLVGTTAPTSGSYIAYANSGGILTGVKTSTPLPTQTYDVTSTGSIGALAQTVVVATNSFDTVGFQVTGTFTGSIAVEASIDGTNYVATTFVALASGGAATFFSVPTIGQINCVGLSYVRFRSTAWTSGTASFTMSSSVGVSNVMLDNPLPIGTNNIGTVGYVQNSTTSTQYGTLIQGAVTTSSPTYTTGQTSPLSLDASGSLRVNVVTGGSGGTVTLAAGANAIGSITNTGFAINGSLPTGANAIGSITNTTFGLSTGTNNIGVTGVAQGSTTSGTYGNLTQGAVTTAAPTYTTGQNSPLSLDTSGLLRVNVVSGGGATTATANAATQSFANGTANSLQADTTGALKVNVIATVGGGGGSSANIGVLGTTAPTSGNYVSFANAGGILTGVTPSNQMPVDSYSTTTQVQVNPTITSGSAYATNNCVGGKLTFANVTRKGSGVLQAITITSKSSNSVGYKLYLFTTNPTNTTFTDKTNVSLNALDVPYLIDYYSIAAYDNGIGTMTIYPFDNIGRSFNAPTNSLYAVIVATGAVTYSSTSDLYITLTVMAD